MIKSGIIGCGVIAPTHLAGFQQIPEVENISFCDLIPAKAEALAAGIAGAKVFTDYREMLADPELQVVSICTDHASHAEIFCAALEAGKHVICEKVPGRVPEDLEKMVATAAKYPHLKTSGIFQHRFNPANIALRNLIQDNRFGKLLTVNLNFACLRTEKYYQQDNWRGTVAGEGGGVLINQAIHFLDQLRFLFGDVRRVVARSANLTHQNVIEVEDTVAFTAEFDRGLFVTVNASNSAFAVWRSALTICGTDAQVEFINEKLSFLDGKDKDDIERIRGILNDADREEKVHGKAYYGTGHTAQLADFISAVINDTAPAVSIADAANSAALVHAVYASAAGGSWCDVKKYS